MDELFPLLLFLIFVLGPIFEQLKKKNQKPQPPHRPAPRQRPIERSSAEVPAQPREAAATMIPEDLWKVLTGEARPPVAGRTPDAPAPKQRPWDVVYIPPEETEDEEESSREDTEVEVRRTRREEVAREHAARHAAGSEGKSLEVPEPNIISLEVPLPSARARHQAFHKKIDAPVPAPPRRKSKLGLTNREELQRAFVLQEIFGRPRGLE
ncbi:MAG: hypothetical protein ACT443_05105 [Gemmatimonadota bacterium]